MQSNTVRLDAKLDIVAIGARGFLWSHHGNVLAGHGDAIRIPLEPGRAAASQDALAALAGPGGVGRPGTGPVAFAALPFDPAATGELIVPEIVLGMGADGERWITVTGSRARALDEIIEELVAVQRATPTTPQPSDARIGSVLTPEVWRDEIVAVARDRIVAGQLRKAVLARELTVSTDQPLDTAAIVQRLVAGHPAAMVFRVDGFVGASPELLVAREADVVRCHPLAGTTSRGADPRADRAAADALLASAKDRGEHRITIDWLLDELLAFCSYADAEPEPTIVTLPNVHHLGTRVEGRLSQPSASVLELVAALHPTPAVGGAPQDQALALIAELERADRGRYAGPVGWVDGAGNGAFAVGIRSAEIDGTHARLFAGVGVVADSDPEAELAETRAKFEAMLPALLRL